MADGSALLFGIIVTLGVGDVVAVGICVDDAVGAVVGVGLGVGVGAGGAVGVGVGVDSCWKIGCAVWFWSIVTSTGFCVTLAPSSSHWLNMYPAEGVAVRLICVPWTYSYVLKLKPLMLPPAPFFIIRPQTMGLKVALTLQLLVIFIINVLPVTFCPSSIQLAKLKPVFGVADMLT